MLWDRGSWEPLHDPETGVSEGKLHFRIHGSRMKGGWILVRMADRKAARKPTGDDKPRVENWLLIKEGDAEANAEPDALTEQYTTSIVTERSMEAISQNEPAPADAGKSKNAKSPARSRPKKNQLNTPAFEQPQLATLIDTAPEGENWLHEIKFDGYRCQAAIGKQGIRLYTRSGLDWSDRFADLLPAFETLPCRSALLDGEVMAGNQSATSAFSALQENLKNGGPLLFYAFDLLVLDGKDLKSSGLLDRKAKLEHLLESQQSHSALQYSTHILGHGQTIYEQICRSGGEGIISKRIDAPYRGTRTKTWLKVKCTKRQEFVVGGYSPSSARGRAFASLLVGEYQQGKLRYRGRVGSGFKEDDITSLSRSFERLASVDSPFYNSPFYNSLGHNSLGHNGSGHDTLAGKLPTTVTRKARWVRPQIVIEVDFSEFTSDGLIRHGVYLGCREDKNASDVNLEVSQPLDTTNDNKGETGIKKRSFKANAKKSPEVHKNNNKKSAPEVAGISISNSDREIFPDAGITKYDLASYYAAAGKRIIQIAGNRPFSFVRCPGGLAGKCFFQKHATKGFPDELHGVDIEESSGKIGRYLSVNSTEGLVAAAQMGVIEFHVWAVRNDQLEKPDRLVFDLDPEEGLDFEQVKAGARTVRERLTMLGLQSTPLLTGGKGIHVCVPLKRTISWQTLKIFAKTLATIMAEQQPEHFTANMSKAKRKGRIFIDWLRNDRGATAIAPYSVRARPRAPVAVPVSWTELDKLNSADGFTIRNMQQRLRKPCPYLAALTKPQTLGKTALTRLQQLNQGLF